MKNIFFIGDSIQLSFCCVALLYSRNFIHQLLIIGNR